MTHSLCVGKSESSLPFAAAVLGRLLLQIVLDFSNLIHLETAGVE